MDIFIDSANVVDIRKWLEMGVIDGVTTNPSIMLKDKVFDVKEGARRIAEVIDPLPLSVEVTTNDLGEMMRQAQDFATWAANIVVKVPQITPDGEPCYGVISALQKKGIRVNATAALSFPQVMLAAKTGATYISIFLGRVTDEGGNAAELIRTSVDWLERNRYSSRLCIGSIRSVGDVVTAAVAGAHIITIPPQFLDKMADHKYTRETVRQFIDDASKALQIMKVAVK